jgi:hypothetical protein
MCVVFGSKCGISNFRPFGVVLNIKRVCVASIDGPVVVLVGSFVLFLFVFLYWYSFTYWSFDYGAVLLILLMWRCTTLCFVTTLDWSQTSREKTFSADFRLDRPSEMRRDSWVGLVTGWTARVRFPAVQDFSLHSVQTDSGPPSLISNGYRWLFRRGV